MTTNSKRYFISYFYSKGNKTGFGSCINKKGNRAIKDIEKELVKQYNFNSAVILNVMPEYIDESEE